MELLDREKIIALGKVLRRESEAGCANSSADGGLDAFLAQWRAEANGAMGYEAVRQTLALLADYEVQPLNARREMLARSLDGLRGLFKNPDGGTDRRPQTAVQQIASKAAVSGQRSAVASKASLAVSDWRSRAQRALRSAVGGRRSAVKLRRQPLPPRQNL